MSAIARLTAAGFNVRLVPPDTIGITPVERLTDLQCQWVTANIDKLLVELHDAAHDPAPTITWQSFVDECIRLGATADEVAAMFRQQDIDDLCTLAVETMSLHARTIVDAIIHKHRTAEPDKSNVYVLNAPISD